jgi:hypothetical protein
MKTLPQPWTAAMEATVFTGWIYDHLRPHAAALKVAHPLMLRAIAAAKKKNDRVDAQKICDCLRCDFLPECYMATTAIRERRRTLRYRNLLVRQMVQRRERLHFENTCREGPAVCQHQVGKLQVQSPTEMQPRCTAAIVLTIPHSRAFTCWRTCCEQPQSRFRNIEPRKPAIQADQKLRKCPDAWLVEILNP